ncbi:hypothetical protein HMI54_008003, partial [Coelomomyces lativittatus]
MSEKEATNGGAGTKMNEKLNTIQKNAIFQETIRKEMRRHQLYDHYALSPKIKKNIVLTVTPNHMTPLQPIHHEFDGEYEKFASNMNKLPREKYTSPQTTNQDYFWESHQLVSNR